MGCFPIFCARATWKLFLQCSFRSNTWKLINKTTFSHIVDQNDNLSSGGMKSKLESARLASNDGIPVIIADGRKENVITEIISGNDEGTFFKTKKN